MKSKYYFIIMLSILLNMSPLCAKEQGFGMLMDAEEDLIIKFEGRSMTIEVGEVIPFDAKIYISMGGFAIVTVFESCEEWELNGRGEYMTTDEGLVKEAGPDPILSRQLPTCFDPEEFEQVGSTIGGVVSRSIGRNLKRIKSNRLEPLWREAATGRASNTTLMTLVMNGVKKHKISRVRPYFEILKQRIPNSAFIKRMKPYF